MRNSLADTNVREYGGRVFAEVPEQRFPCWLWRARLQQVNVPRGNCSLGRTHVVAALFEPLGRAHAGAEKTRDEEGAVMKTAQLLPALNLTSGGEVIGEKLSLGKEEESLYPQCVNFGILLLLSISNYQN